MTQIQFGIIGEGISRRRLEMIPDPKRSNAKKRGLFFIAAKLPGFLGIGSFEIKDVKEKKIYQRDDDWSAGVERAYACLFIYCFA